MNSNRSFEYYLEVQQSFRNTAVRQLASLLISPSLLAHQSSVELLTTIWHKTNYERHLSWLKSIDQNPEALEKSLLSDHRLLLGKYAERLMAFFWSNSPYYELVAQNVSIREKNITKGEIDFIVRDLENGRCFQIELAVKFYLSRTQGVRQWENYIGPDGKDRLDLKMNKLLNRQSQWLKKQPEIAEHFCGTTDVPCYLFLKGCLFEHIQESGTKQGDRLLPAWWMYESEWESHPYKSKRMQVIQKPQWLFPCFQSNVIASVEHESLNERLKSGKSSLLLLEDEGILNWGFVVPDHWPN